MKIKLISGLQNVVKRLLWSENPGYIDTKITSVGDFVEHLDNFMLIYVILSKLCWSVDIKI